MTKSITKPTGSREETAPACDYSWNCGAEGSTRKRSVLKLRQRQMKNAFAMMLLAQGTPVLLAGDEIGNSQQGNNNPYCHRQRAYLGRLEPGKDSPGSDRFCTASDCLPKGTQDPAQGESADRRGTPFPAAIRIFPATEAGPGTATLTIRTGMWG